ncbi:MAG: 2-dehydropantoate 2-reductase [Sphingomicrobium sp.]
MHATDGPRIGVVGAGAIGGWVAAKLAIAGEQVSVLARGETLRLLRAEGLRLDEKGVETVVRVGASDDPAALGIQDLLLVAVKATALPGLAAKLAPLIDSRTLILLMLNGVPWWFVPGEPLQSVDPDGSIARTFPLDQVVGCVVHASCSRAAPNRVRVNHADRLIIGETGGGEPSDRLARLFAMLDRAGLRPDLTGNVRRAIWYKLWGNATINPLSALTRATCDVILADPQCRAWMLEGMGELAKVGASIGCPISESGDDRMAVTAKLGAFKTSMLQDVEAGRPIELDALLGAPREIARRAGIATPALDRLYGVTKLMAISLGIG